MIFHALLHRSSFLVRESLGLLAGRGDAVGGLPRFLLWAHGNLVTLTCLTNRAADRTRDSLYYGRTTTRLLGRRRSLKAVIVGLGCHLPVLPVERADLDGG